MDAFELHASGDVVEWQELLNGTETVTLKGATADGAWTLSSVVSWNLGLVEFEGEGDLTLTRDDGSEIFATLERAEVSDSCAADDEADVALRVRYVVDGGSGEFEGSEGHIAAELRVTGGRFEGIWRTEGL
jgi:hypothetical protein